VLHEKAVGFHIPIGLNDNNLDEGIASRPISETDVPTGQLYLGHKKGRMLPVASSRFASQLCTALEQLSDASRNRSDSTE